MGFGFLKSVKRLIQAHEAQPVNYPARLAGLWDCCRTSVSAALKQKKCVMINSFPGGLEFSYNH